MKRMWKALALSCVAIGAALWASRAPVVAHHSFAVVYLEQDTIEIEGEVVEFQYRIRTRGSSCKVPSGRETPRKSTRPSG